jgi:hypothetical protein
MGTTVEFEHMHTIEKLRARFGEDECRRLGFLTEDEGVTCLTAVGLGYLTLVEATGVTSLAEAFAAGFECGANFSPTV